MKFEYRVSELQARYFDVSLNAQAGRFYTKNHQFGLEADTIKRRHDIYSFKIFL